MNGNNRAISNFKLISNFTGGILIANQDAMDAILETLKSEFEDVSLDSKILEMMSKNKDPEEICNLLKIDRDTLTESKTRIVQYY